MEPWVRSWLEEKRGDALARGRTIGVEELGELPGAAFAVWHPLDDLYKAPVVRFEAAPSVRAITVDGELAGYVFSHKGDVASWTVLGDASTDADRFFLVELDQFEPVIEWLNDALDEFEELGGQDRLELVERGGTKVAVLQSPDGNAKIRGGLDGAGNLVCAILST